jgi:3-oxoacyl-[acyl-carrier protein] reductase
MNGVDLGIEGRTALVCGSSRGLGKACAFSLATAGVEVILNGRNEETLRQSVGELSALIGRPVASVVGDVTTETGRVQVLSVCAQPDILVTNSGGPPPGSFEDWGEPEWLAALNANMVAPIQIIRRVIGGMRGRRWGRIINITSSAVKAPLPLLGLSNGARAGLTGFVAGLAREVARDGVTINNMLPGNFATDRLDSYVRSLASRRGIVPSAVMHELKAANPTGRVGDPREFGAMCAFICSTHAGYFTGQNVLLDGGAYPGVF